jgi:hypothetical protein
MSIILPERAGQFFLFFAEMTFVKTRPKKISLVKTLIRDLDTDLLYCSPGQWVESWMQATDFKDLQAAWDFGMTLDRRNLEVFVVDDSGQPSWGRRIDRTHP